jgi:hypothetical protein
MMKRFICAIGLSKVALWPPDPVFYSFSRRLDKESLRSRSIQSGTCEVEERFCSSAQDEKISGNYFYVELNEAIMQNVEIRVEGIIDQHWSEWLEGLEITHQGGDETLLSGQVVDQATLYGILKKLRDLGLKLLLVKINGD